MTLRSSRNSTIFVGLAVVFDDLAGLTCRGLRDVDDLLAGAAQPTGVTPRSAAVTVSTGFDLAAMMPLKLG